MTKKKDPKDLLKVGRPPLYKSVKDLDAKIYEYFTDCPDKRIVKLKDCEGAEYQDKVPCPTLTGLTLFLGFCDKQSLYDYEQNKPEFTCSIKRARTFIEREYENMLYNGQCTGAIFALKNMGWSDKTQTELTGANGSDLVQKVYITAKQQKAVADHIKKALKGDT
jgi:hypothetical protein